jgi:hypothetical protein
MPVPRYRWEAAVSTIGRRHLERRLAACLARAALVGARTGRQSKTPADEQHSPELAAVPRRALHLRSPPVASAVRPLADAGQEPVVMRGRAVWYPAPGMATDGGHRPVAARPALGRPRRFDRDRVGGRAFRVGTATTPGASQSALEAPAGVRSQASGERPSAPARFRCPEQIERPVATALGFRL